MHRKKRGTLKSGSGRRVKSRKQAIAIGLSEARKKGRQGSAAAQTSRKKVRRTEEEVLTKARRAVRSATAWSVSAISRKSPCFPRSRTPRNSRLAALVSDDAGKRRALGREVPHRPDLFLRRIRRLPRQVDAVYIALPNSMHAEYTIRAARAGVHVLCEKPMAVTVEECDAMIDACRRHRVKLMIAYRLHFEEINLGVIDLVRKGRIGAPKFFNSSFSLTVRAGNIRTDKQLGGGTLVRHRRLLHQRRPPHLPGRAEGSRWRCRSTAAPAGSRRSTSPPARLLRFDGEPRRRVRDQLQRRRRRLLPDSRHQGATSTSIPPTSTPKDSPTS